MTNTNAHAMTAKNEVLGCDEMSAGELDAVTGGEVAIKIFGQKITAGDVADAAKWVWHKLF